MKYTVMPGRELSGDLVQIWAQIQQSNPALASPYFCPEFTSAIAAVCDDVEVAVIEDAGKIAAFFPFARCGLPVGGRISDYHGIICAPDFTCDPRALIKACSLAVWDFNHLIAAQGFFAKFHRNLEPSPQIDLTAGFDAYVKQRPAAASEPSRKGRALERDIGPLRFVAHTSEPAVLRQVLEWKFQQYGYHKEWVVAALKRIHATQTPGFAGMLSALYAGDTLVAGHFGMRSKEIWHWWFPAYAKEYSRYSPGLLLLIKMAENAAGLGLRVIDLGKGMMPYKERFKNAEVLVAEGSIERPSITAFRRQLQRGSHQLKHGVRELVIGSSLEKPVRNLLRVKKRIMQPSKAG
jgi:CelD/BcsL family acetyltransferase involved in cellulose biosynthesis